MARFYFRLAQLHGQFRHPLAVQCFAGFDKRARCTLRRRGGTPRRSEVHHRLIEIGCLPFGQERLRQFGKEPLSLRGVDGGIDAEVASEYPIGVAIDGSHGQIESKRADGCCRIVAHPFQAPQPFIGLRESAFRHHLTRSRMQVSRPAVIAQPLPQAQHIVFRSRCQRLHRGKTLHEPLPIGQSLFDARLLQDNLTQPDGIGIAVRPPREAATMLLIPAQKRCCERRHIHHLRYPIRSCKGNENFP